MIYWLKEGRYSELRDEDWEDIKAGKIRL
jgi:hypothetical protein